MRHSTRFQGHRQKLWGAVTAGGDAASATVPHEITESEERTG